MSFVHSGIKVRKYTLYEFGRTIEHICMLYLYNIPEVSVYLPIKEILEQLEQSSKVSLAHSVFDNVNFTRTDRKGVYPIGYRQGILISKVIEKYEPVPVYDAPSKHFLYIDLEKESAIERLNKYKQAKEYIDSTPYLN